MARHACTLEHYMHSQHMIDTATMEFLLPPRNTHTQLSCGLAKIRKRQTALSALLFPDAMVQLTISHPISPTLSSLYLTIVHHTLKTQNTFSTLLKNLLPSQPIHR